MCPKGAFDHEPDRFVRISIVTQGDLSLGEFVLDGPFGAFGDSPPVPKAVMEASSIPGINIDIYVHFLISYTMP